MNLFHRFLKGIGILSLGVALGFGIVHSVGKGDNLKETAHAQVFAKDRTAENDKDIDYPNVLEEMTKPEKNGNIQIDQIEFMNDEAIEVEFYDSDGNPLKSEVKNAILDFFISQLFENGK
ncbi:hypothetical protein DCC39_02460 [Pueribacillus theae]|uniref:Uncharacterized protein n=1 Tax=Pueribacillus theae TaxID=2171751 RepID=A0A2U1K7Q0_9BACI|nr:hypothetical protein [Pueribacillus theae]PWA13013.1 hypothetical protein DCC39_02460 [Pueribacillus theae]